MVEDAKQTDCKLVGSIFFELVTGHSFNSETPFEFPKDISFSKEGTEFMLNFVEGKFTNLNDLVTQEYLQEGLVE